MKKQLLLSLCALAVLSGCASQGAKERVSGDYRYLDAQPLGDGFKVPEDLEVPPRSAQYSLPNLESSNTSQLLGDQVRISSPRLVLPLVAGSHVEEGSEDAKVLFDQIDDSEALDKTIWDKVLAYLEENNIGVESFDRENNVLTTDWVISREEVDGSWYEFSDDYVEQAKKFTLSLQVAPHGRTASLQNDIVAYVNENGNESLASMDPITRRTNEVDFLNFIIAEYDFGLRLAQSQRIAKIRDGFSSSLGFNSDGDSSFIVDASYNDAWPRLLLVLRKMGFDVIDLDQSSGIMFVAFNGEDEGWWSGLFSDEGLDLEEDNYRIFVERLGQKTAVTFKDDENIPFSPDKVTDIFAVFDENMSSDNLDI
jgi:outer membrane protein assembly factor BamC